MFDGTKPPEPESKKKKTKIKRQASKILQPENAIEHDSKKRQKMYTKHVEVYFKSPFRHDREFILEYLAKVTTNDMTTHEDAVEKLFYDGIYKIITTPGESEKNVLMSLDLLGNMISS